MAFGGTVTADDELDALRALERRVRQDARALASAVTLPGKTLQAPTMLRKGAAGDTYVDPGPPIGQERVPPEAAELLRDLAEDVQLLTRIAARKPERLGVPAWLLIACTLIMSGSSLVLGVFAWLAAQG